MTSLARGDAAVVIEFAPSAQSDVDAICALAESLTARIIVVAQEMSERERKYLDAHFSHLKNLEVHAIGAPLGRGAAIRLGLQKVTEPYVAIVTIDFSIDPRQVEESFLRIHATPEIDGLSAYRTDRRWYGHLYNAFTNALFGLASRDVQSPLKIFRTSALSAVIDELQLFNHGFDADLMYRMRRKGSRIVEVPARGYRLSGRWPLMPSARRALAALVSLRVLESRIGSNPIVMRLGRPYVLTSKASYSILIFCWRDPRSPKAGGGEVYLHEQARCWVKQGHRVTWVASRFAGSLPNEAVDGIDVIRRGRSLLVFPAAALWYVLHSGWRFDFMLDVMNGVPFFTPLFSSKPKACLLYHVHSHHFRDELPRPLSDLAVWIETKLVPRIYRRTQFLTISESTAAEMRELNITKLPLEIIHSGVSDAMRPGRKHPQPTILYLGRLRRYKGLRKLIDAFATIRRTTPDARLVIAGTGDDETALREYARGTAGVYFVGAVDEDTKIRLYQEAWVFGMPSTMEGWGIVVIEAARCGTPAVAYDVNGLRDCILTGETGILVNDDASFAESLDRLLTDTDLRERLGKNAVTWGDQFSWDRTAARTLHQIRRAQPWNSVFAIETQTELPQFPLFTDDGSTSSESDAPSAR